MAGLPTRPASWRREATSPALAPAGISMATGPLAVPLGVSPYRQAVRATRATAMRATALVVEKTSRARFIDLVMRSPPSPRVVPVGVQPPSQDNRRRQLIDHFSTAGARDIGRQQDLFRLDRREALVDELDRHRQHAPQPFGEGLRGFG